MSIEVLKEIVFVAMGDETFRRKLVFDPDETLARYELTEAEFRALRLGDRQKMIDMGLDQNLAAYGSMLFSKKR